MQSSNLRSLRLGLALSVIVAAALASCGGGEPSPGEAPASAADSPAAAAPAATGQLNADGTIASHLAQPSDTDPAVLLADGSAADGGEGTARIQAAPRHDPVAVELGNLLFHDESLSASGKMACGTCHLEAFGHADKPGTRLPKGGPSLDLSGMRSSMTVRYLKTAPPFRLSLLGTPSGGFLWDGRADNHFEQVFHAGPFFNPVEQALPGSASAPKSLTDKVRAAPYWPQIQAHYAAQPNKIATDQALFREVATLIQTYQLGDEDYAPFDSKFDRVVAGTASFTAAEARGWGLFSNPLRGNCTACHSATRARPGSLFTSFGYAAIGVPRNHEAPKNADPRFFDLGLCTRQKVATNNAFNDALVKSVPRYCGLFKIPTLRNVSRTAPYFHNGSMSTLEDVVRFYFRRDTHSSTIYRKADGSPDRRLNDLPLQYQGNVAFGPPFNLLFYTATEQDIADIVAFLKTLADADQTTPLQ